MKNNPYFWFGFCLFCLLSIPHFVPAQKLYLEEDGLLIVEIKSQDDIMEWETGSATLGDQSIQYLYSEMEYFRKPGNQLLTYKIRITNPGTYKFIWHSKVGEGFSPTDYNDSWLRIPDASDFYAQKENGQILHPKGVCTDDCPDGMGAAGWFKAYSHGTTDWTWRAKTSDKDPHEIYARFDNAGTYSIQISARSSYHFLHRFVMYQPDQYTEVEITDLALPPNEWVTEKVEPVGFGLKVVEATLAENGGRSLKTEAISRKIISGIADHKQNSRPFWTNRVGYVDFEKSIDWVAGDITIAKQEQ
jgi:hypothetical protein